LEFKLLACLLRKLSPVMEKMFEVEMKEKLEKKIIVPEKFIEA
jgi:hypothetical protein